MTRRPPKLFMGMGHLLRRDDGVGVRAAERMAAQPLPDEVEVYDAGVSGFELSAVVEHRDLVVVVDAIDAGDVPGALFRMTPEELRPAALMRLTLHGFHLLDALDETQLLGTAPRAVVVLGIQPLDVSVGIGLSAPVTDALDLAIPLALRELGLPGVSWHSRNRVKESS